MQTALSPFITGDLTAFEALALKVDDPRPHPEETALAQSGEAILNEMLDLITDTALEDFQSTILEGLIGGVHSALERIRRDADRARDDARRLMRDFDGSEVGDTEIQDATRRFTAADVAVMALEILRDAAASNYTVQTGEVWTPWRGSVRPSRATAAMIDAKDALRAHRQRGHSDVDPGAVVVAFRGAPQAVGVADAHRIFDALNWALAAHPDMALATCAAPGSEKLALRWAAQKKVRVILVRPDFDRHRNAAPFKANDALMAFDPALVLTLPASLDPERDPQARPSGVVLNLGQKAEDAGIRHIRIAAR
jgi:hypothetical protein